MYLGFGGAVTYKGAKRAARVLAAIPHDRALLETDCPYMAPEPVRGTRNDSRNIVHVAAYIGTLWDMDAQAVLDQTAANARACLACNFFGIFGMAKICGGEHWPAPT